MIRDNETGTWVKYDREAENIVKYQEITMQIQHV